MKTRLLSIALLSASIFAFSGCATILHSQKDSLQVASEPAGAKVYVNGEYMGDTPVKLKLKADKTYTIEMKKPGYDTVTRTVNSKVGAGWVVLDIVTGVFPLVVDAITGDWKKLDQKSIDAILAAQQ